MLLKNERIVVGNSTGTKFSLGSGLVPGAFWILTALKLFQTLLGNFAGGKTSSEPLDQFQIIGIPDPVLGCVLSSMVAGQSPVCLLLQRIRSGCPVEFSKGNRDMGKQVEVRNRNCTS